MKTHDLVFSKRPNLSILIRLFLWFQRYSFCTIWRILEADKEHCSATSFKQQKGSVISTPSYISLTNNVICRVALGRRYDERKFNNLLQNTIELLGCFSVGAYIPSLRWVDQLSGLERRVDKVAKEFDAFLESVLEEHANKNRVDVKCENLVDVLLEVQRDNTTGFPLEDDMIKVLILDIFLAGTDTTFTSLKWALCELLRHPQAMKELQQEALKIGQGRSMIG
ncbi:putative cytochrome P450 [Helianthus anomalus]